MKQMHLELGSQKLNLLASLIFLISLDSFEAFKDIGLFTCPPFVSILNNCSPSFPAAGCHTCLCAIRPVPRQAHTLTSLLFSVQGELWPHHFPHATHGALILPAADLMSRLPEKKKIKVMHNISLSHSNG